jgi:hypothetical protein
MKTIGVLLVIAVANVLPWATALAVRDTMPAARPGPWQRLSLAGFPAVDSQMWGGGTKEFTLHEHPIHRWMGPSYRLAFADRATYEQVEKLTGSLVRVDGYEITRGYTSWVLVESVQEINTGGE